MTTKSSDESTLPSGPTAALLTIQEVCDFLRVSQWTFHQLVNSNRLRTITLGKRRLVARQDLEAFLDELRAEGTRHGR